MFFCTEIKKSKRGLLAIAVQDEKGQATVEAAFLIPIIFVLLLLLIQPAILLYNHMVMQGAASEACRLLATKTDAAGASKEKYEGFILRRLGSIPSQDNFHIHRGGCSWEIEISGDETSETVKVSITNQVKLLPLFDEMGSLFRLYGASGAFEQKVEIDMPTQPSWVFENNQGLNPQKWVEERL